MRTLLTCLLSLTCLLLATVMLRALGQPRTVDICERTPQVRDAILQALEADDCAAVYSDPQAAASPQFGGMAALPFLFVEGATTLQAGDFDGLTGLHMLGLSGHLSEGGNQLTTLPAGVFDGLFSFDLEEHPLTLDLSHNALTTLPAGVFDGLTNLQELYLGYNQLETLPAGVFDGLTGLRRLDLEGNALTTLPAGVFDGLTNLQRLDLSGNRNLARLTRKDPLFAGLPSGVIVVLGGEE